MTDVEKDARTAAQPPDLVEIARDALDAERLPIQGFVVATGAEFLLLHVLSDRIDLDGYSAFRIGDISALKRDFPKKSFYLKALELGCTPLGLTFRSRRPVALARSQQ